MDDTKTADGPRPVTRIFKNTPCRKCGVVPVKGYAKSRVIRHDYICSMCLNEQTLEYKVRKHEREARAARQAKKKEKSS